MTPNGSETFRGTRIDHGAFARIARDVFGIENPIELSRRRGSRNHGSHSSTVFDHRIMLNPAMHRTVEDACRTLAHELWHCVQVESQPWREYVTAHRAETRAYSYEERPREVDARAAEDAFWQELLPALKVPSNV